MRSLRSVAYLTYYTLFLCCVASAQGDITFRFEQEYSIYVPNDSVYRCDAVDVDGDSKEELLYGDLGHIVLVDFDSGQMIIDTIFADSNFIYTPFLENGQVWIYMLYCTESWVQPDSIKMLRFPFSDPSEVDTFMVGIGFFPNQQNEAFSRFSAIQPYYPNSDSVTNFLVFWDCWYQDAYNMGEYGRFCAFDHAGNLISQSIQTEKCYKVSTYSYSDSFFLAVAGRGSFNNPDGGHYWSAMRVFNDSLIPVYVASLDGFRNIDYKLDLLVDDSFRHAARIINDSVTLYDNTYFVGGVNRYFQPNGGVACFFGVSDSTYLLTGYRNFRLILYDMSYNRYALAYGPNVNLNDIDRIDIDHDGTDELLCRTSTGFVVYRLDTTSVSVADDDFPLPGRVSIFAYPNPFNSSATISLLGLDDDCEIAIYDMAGRLVRRLRTIERRVIWDGRNENGVDARSGVYIARARGDNLTATTRIVLLR